MPLEAAAPGTPGFSRNVEREVAAGKPVKQAIAIAYSKSGEGRSDAAYGRDGGVIGPNGKWYPTGTKFHLIGGKVHPISPGNNVNIRERKMDRLDAALAAADELATRCDAVGRAADAEYNPQSVQKAIENNRTGKIGGKEAKMIHALLKGSSGYASRRKDEAEETKERHEGKLSETEREKIGTAGSPKREEMPRSVFLKPSERKYPVKEKKGDAWEYDRELLLAAARRARMQGDDDLAREADTIREREFGAAKADANPLPGWQAELKKLRASGGDRSRIRELEDQIERFEASDRHIRSMGNAGR